MHRSLGTHISKVRSVSLDSWTREQVDQMLSMGNKRAAEIWEYHLPPNFQRPTNSAQRETFIRAKYERGRYKRRSTDPPLPEASAPAAAAPAADAARSAKSEEKARRKEERRAAAAAAAAAQPAAAPGCCLGPLALSRSPLSM